MYDNNFNAGSGVVFSGIGGASITQNITINAADISKKSEIFGEIDAQALPEGANSWQLTDRSRYKKHLKILYIVVPSFWTVLFCLKNYTKFK